MTTVYLAGGFKTDWANDVIVNCPSIKFINPKDKEYKNGERISMDVQEYGLWDIHYIRQCEIVFVYVQNNNPSCIGLSCEAGYAKGLGKTVISVIEPNNQYIKDSYLSFIGVVSDIVFTDIEHAIQYLKSYQL